MTPSPELILAVDGGASSTLALVATLDGHILGSGLAGPSNHVHEPGGMERLTSALHGSIRAALAAADVPAEAVIGACLGMTGGALEAKPIAQGLLPAAAILSYHDSVTALAGASQARPGVVVIAGTGSVAYGRLDDGCEVSVGGWGFIMGDEGSGYDVGRHALRAATQASDGRGPVTALLEAIPVHYGLADLRAVHRAIYTGAIDRPGVAGLTAVVAKAAEAGDGVARDLLAAAGRDLATAALAVIRALDRTADGLAVYPAGGVFRAGELVLASFRETLHAASPRSRVETAAFSPVIGGLLLACQAAGREIDDGLLAAIRATLPGAALAKQEARRDA